MRLRHYLAAAFVVASFSAAATEVISLSAHPGEFNVKTLGPVSATTKVSASARIAKFNGTAAWPPAAYVGFYQGPDRNHSVQFLIIRNHETDSYVVAGYRVIESGREARVESLETLPLNSEARVHMSFSNGVVTLRLNNGTAHTIKTKLRRVAPYVAVSSSTGEFKIERPGR